MDVNLEKRHISELIIVYYFDKDVEVRTKVRELESSFKNIFPNQSRQTNASDTDRDLNFRIINNHENYRLGVSQVTVQIDIDLFDLDWASDVAKCESEFNGILKKTNRAMLSFKKESEIKYTGIIFRINYPGEITRVDGVKHINSQFIKNNLFEDITETTVRLGWKLDNKLFFHLAPTHYTVRGGGIEAKPGTTSIKIDYESLPILEQGLELYVDINNKPKVEKSESKTTDTKIMLDTFFDFLDTDANKIMGFQ